MAAYYEIPQRLATIAMQQAAREIESNHRKGIFDDGDPNHPKYNAGVNYAARTIFGHDEAAFLRRQYK